MSTSKHEGSKKIGKKEYESELLRLQIEMIKLQEWIKHTKDRVVVIFEGRDAAGKGGVIKRITQHLSPRDVRVVAPARTHRAREKHSGISNVMLHTYPPPGEMVILDRSWYNRAGVERVMGFCTDDEYDDFMRACPNFERMLIRSGIKLIKYWFSVNDEEQERRFQARMDTSTKRWKLSPMDLESRDRWQGYSKAKDAMFSYTDTKQSPWFVVNADIKKPTQRLNTMAHLLSLFDYEDLTPKKFSLPKRAAIKGEYVRLAHRRTNVYSRDLPQIINRAGSLSSI